MDRTATDTFAYTIQNAAGAQDTATVTVTINGANDARPANLWFFLSNLVRTR